MSDTPRTWTIEDHPGRPLTVNRLASMHRQAWATHTRHTREAWAWLARQAELPRLERCRITATPLHANRRSLQDPSACAPEVKAAIDGLVDAGVLADDNGDHVAAIEYLPPEITGRDGLRIQIEEQPQP